MLQDCDSFDVEDWMLNTLSGSEFPVIFCINSCRIDVGASDDTTFHELKATTLEVPKNVFLTWGSAKGDLAGERDFVKFWRYKIATDFMKKDINTVASDVLVDCKGGRTYSGLDPRKGVCKGGVWEVTGHLGPSNTNPERQRDLIKSCIAFAMKASGKRSGGGAGFESEEKYSISVS